MDQKTAKTQLGLAATAAADRVEAIYKRRSKVLKRRLVEADTVEEREKHRGALKNLVYLRDIALGPQAAAAYRARQERQKKRGERRKDWWSPSAGIPARIASRDSALVFFGLGTDAGADEIRRAFFQRSRALKREIAHAQTDADLRFLQSTLRRLNELLRRCFEPSPVEEPIGASDVLADLDATHTEIGSIFEDSETEKGPELEITQEEKEEEGPELEFPDEPEEAEEKRPKANLSDSVWDINIEATSLKDLRPHDEEKDS